MGAGQSVDLGRAVGFDKFRRGVMYAKLKEAVGRRIWWKQKSSSIDFAEKAVRFGFVCYGQPAVWEVVGEPANYKSMEQT